MKELSNLTSPDIMKRRKNNLRFIRNNHQMLQKRYPGKFIAVYDSLIVSSSIYNDKVRQSACKQLNVKQLPNYVTVWFIEKPCEVYVNG